MTSIILSDSVLYVLSYEDDENHMIVFDDFTESVAAYRKYIREKHVKPSITRVDLRKMQVMEVDSQDIVFEMAMLEEEKPVKTSKPKHRLRLFGR